jgi:hypothetical protein
MIGGGNLIPHGVLFGGHKFMLFSLFRNADTLGEVRYGLACSDIIDCTNPTTPFIPLMIYTLLDNTGGPVQLRQPTFTIPPIPRPVIQDSGKPVTRSKLQKFVSSISPVCIPSPTSDVSHFLFPEKGHLPYPCFQQRCIQVFSATPRTCCPRIGRLSCETYWSLDGPLHFPDSL